MTTRRDADFQELLKEVSTIQRTPVEDLLLRVVGMACAETAPAALRKDELLETIPAAHRFFSILSPTTHPAHRGPWRGVALALAFSPGAR